MFFLARAVDAPAAETRLGAAIGQLMDAGILGWG
jgi:hypothetical protein